jgi:hypothetical protein
LLLLLWKSYIPPPERKRITKFKKKKKKKKKKMATLIWRAIFAFLIGELLVTLILVLPVPRKIRNYLARKIFLLQLGDRLAKPILFIGIALTLALVESFVTHNRLLNRLVEEDLALEMLARKGEYGVGGAALLGSAMTAHDKERKYKTERNMYLAGFALTLVFVIGRLTQLMEENVELEEECDRLHQQPAPTGTTTARAGDDKATTGEVEMKPMRKKPSEKKKD